MVAWDDEAIVAALVAGEAGAWDYFVERYAGVVEAAVRRVLRGRGLRPAPSDVDDISENVFVLLLERDAALLRRYDPRYALAAYLAVIARTAVHRWLRRRKATTDLPDEMWGESLADPRAAPVSEDASRGEVRDALLGVLESLPERDQRVLRLCYYEGLDYQAIADRLGVAVNSVGATLSRARARLARALKQHDGLTESDWRSV